MKKLTLFLLALLPIILFAQTATTSFAFTHVNIVDVKDGVIKKDITVIITGNQITAIGKKIFVPKNAEIINATGKYLIPGLWDMHGHFLNRWDRSAPLYIANGVTGVRDMATSLSLNETKRILNKVLNGELLGPRFITPGPLLDGPLSRFPSVALAITSKERAIKVADSLKEAGADFYKTYDGLPKDAFYAIIQKGKEYNLAVAGHVPFSVTSEEASEAGMKSLEHIKFVAPPDTNVANPTKYFRDAMWALAKKDTLGVIENNRKGIELAFKFFDEKYAIEKGRIYAKNHTWITPTLVQSMKGFYKKENLINDKNWKYMPEMVVARWRERLMSDVDVMRFDNPVFAKLQLRTINDFHKARVRFLAGTDANDAFIGNIPGFSVHDEMQLFVKSGLSNLEALQTATINPAIYLNALDSMGTVEQNKIADLVLLNANPLNDIHNTQKISAVVANGKYFSRKDLDKMLEDVEEMVKNK